MLKLNEEIKNIQESADPENLRENVVKFIKERNKLEEYISEIEEQIKKLQQQSAVATELNVQKELKCNKDSQFRRSIILVL